jgi:hypothetical protein
MAGKGKYTVYNVPKSSRKSFLEKMFSGNERATPPFLGKDGSESLNEANSRGNDILKARYFIGAEYNSKDGIVYTGDPALPAVDLTYRNRTGLYQAPNTLEAGDVKWSQPGDPANSYTPDITSPGPGKTGGLDKSVDPNITVKDIKPNYDTEKATENTRSPHEAGSSVYDSNILGNENSLVMGRSTPRR